MAAGKYNITIDQGSDFSIQLTVKESGTAKNLTGYNARAQLRTTQTASSVAAGLIKSTGMEVPPRSRTWPTRH